MLRRASSRPASSRIFSISSRFFFRKYSSSSARPRSCRESCSVIVNPRIDRTLGLLVELGKRLACDAERIDAGRYAAIDRHLQEHLADLFPGDAVPQGASDMELQLVRPVERGNHRQVEHAARLL